MRTVEIVFGLVLSRDDFDEACKVLRKHGKLLEREFVQGHEQFSTVVLRTTKSLRILDRALQNKVPTIQGVGLDFKEEQHARRRKTVAAE